MLVATGKGADTQWFDYRPAFFAEIVRVEWDSDTMSVVLPVDVSEYLLRNHYAREMTNEEAGVYNRLLEEAETEVEEVPPPRKSRKGEES
ncbi:hypothetical protein [Bradyrhizobium elkanii]|nr:hypothetical protein [Bradyrhizobium elkanii]